MRDWYRNECDRLRRELMVRADADGNARTYCNELLKESVQRECAYLRGRLSRRGAIREVKSA